MQPPATYTAFAGKTLIASGALPAMLPEVKARFDRHPNDLFVFEDQTGRQVDFHLHGDLDDVLSRAIPEPPPAGPGRPKLGVTSREISLLPRHWAWLEQQPNGSSAAIRRLVDQAMKSEPAQQRARLAMDTTCRFMSSMAGDLPGYEEATRALYAADGTRFENLIQGWPGDIRTYILRIAEPAFAGVERA